MFSSDTYGKFKPCPRKFFGNDRGADSLDVPDLMQKTSYEDFLQIDVAHDKREDKGLEALLKSSFPISDSDGRATIEYVSYRLGDAKYDVWEALQRGVNYSAPLFVALRMIIWDIPEEGEGEDDLHGPVHTGDFIMEDESFESEDDDDLVDFNKKTQPAAKKEIKNIKEQEVYLGDIPIMTDVGAFIVNGAQRVIVSQMHRSPGVFYFRDDGKSNSAGKYIYSARVIPYRGLWLDIEFDSRDILYFRIDKKRKILLTTLLLAMGYDRQRIIREFNYITKYKLKGGAWITDFNPDLFFGTVLEYDIINAETNQVVLKKGSRVTHSLRKELKDTPFEYILPDEKLIGSYSVSRIKSRSSAENSFVVEAGGVVTADALEELKDNKEGYEVELITNVNQESNYILDTLNLDENKGKQEALIEIYRVMKSGEQVTAEVAESFFQSMFYGEGRYDLSKVGRMKINMKHDFDVSEEYKYLRLEDIVAFIKHLISIKDGGGEVDDIDSLANRRVRCVGELLENQFKVAISRISSSIAERLNIVDLDAVMLHDFVNSKALSSVINEFFGTSQLSQFMDQTNPLSEVTHKRRISSLGPGGLSRERASADARDVHPTHYGRICPIETPEGQNIGLIGSLSSYAITNEYGFIETPYLKVENGAVMGSVHYISAIEEGKYIIAQANEPLDEENRFTADLVSCRRGGDFISAMPADVDYIDVSPKQLVSIAASMIPFLENDDASRALMGANMQRQAVPLLRGEAPLVGTGMEGVVAKSSGASVFAKRGGVVEKVDASRIIVRVNPDEYFDIDSTSNFRVHDEYSSSDQVDAYTIIKCARSNNSTIINHRVVVDVGDKVEAGQLLADGVSTDKGEIALGKNALVAFMPWNGYNFEDSILISERLVHEEAFTSIQIQQYDVIARDTMLGPEEITRSIPGVADSELSSLDESGVVNVGATVKPNDIIVGKVAPKSETPLLPEEKLLRAIFGEKVADVKDASLRVPPGEGGTVIGVWVFTRRGFEKSERAIASEKMKIDEKMRNYSDLLSSITSAVHERVSGILIGQKVSDEEPIKFTDNTISEIELNRIPHENWWSLDISDEAVYENLQKIKRRFEETKAKMQEDLDKSIERIQSGDDLAQGALQVVKVLIAKKMKLQSGDKMAGRHGNKGVVSRIVPIEDMPFLEDGTPIDILLNPIGVPSRMNVGQILETHLGWASANLGKQIGKMLDRYFKENDKDCLEDLKGKIGRIYQGNARWANGKKLHFDITNATDEEVLDLAQRMRNGVPFANPVFEGASEADIEAMLKEAGEPVSGQMKLIDGRTGEYFDREVTVGYIYMMKLDHLVENKVHARSIGAYSLVTQQPLGGKSHFGGQRFGEMECWALQAYGAAYTLQEILTVKSDDVAGRVKMYEKIVKGDCTFDCGIPESFNVMVKELRSLGINIEGINTEHNLAKTNSEEMIDKSPGDDAGILFGEDGIV